MGRFSRQFGQIYRDTASDIFKFAKALNFEPTWQQAKVMAAVQRGDRRIAVRSGQGPGKTTVSCVIGLWRCWRSENSLTIVTAPTMRQCKDVWLVEARRRIAKADPLIQKFIKITKTKVIIAERDDWGVKLVTATREENAQGYHQDNMTVIMEEASGIPRDLVTQFKGTLSNPDSLLLQIGNPNTRDCSFFDSFNAQRHQWTPLVMNAEDTARDYPWLLDPQRNLDLEDEFGRDSDVYRVRVLGEFPHTDPNCVMSSEDLEACMVKENMLKYVLTPRPEEYGGGIAKQIGMDVARFGGDESTIFRRSGMSIVEWKHFAHIEPNRLVDHAFRMQSDAGWYAKDTQYVVDAGGMGQGIMANFYDAKRKLYEFYAQAAAYDASYDNQITEAWFRLAKQLRSGECYLPRDNQLLQQLSGRHYYTTRKGKLILETKDDYVKRGHEHSPDRADGCVFAFYDRPHMKGRVTGAGSGTIVGRAVSG